MDSGEILLIKVIGGILLLDGAIAIAMKNDTRPIRIVESGVGLAFALG